MKRILLLIPLAFASCDSLFGASGMANKAAVAPTLEHVLDRHDRAVAGEKLELDELERRTAERSSDLLRKTFELPLRQQPDQD